ncbi:DUF2634 domain-containing protein [Paenibacillus vini]|uniref:DUF2634 domain-containing protein n=1 Tax=Paenibacillus vini TaxID=1476024 RepID=UPI0025B6ED1B|nr:DUF2634 domain-containing protein [Paenibacillus vini]MDN4069273.1 DUF2634 domain-containing protein [Paenibacillus vini]MDN4069326.1 DUF2634 domain-containing protein [Paenibacillus vini]
MIPIGGSLEDVEVQEETSRTYGIDFTSGKATGLIDGLEAVKQAVYKILQTDRFAHLIYDANYGSEINGLQGRSQGYVRSEIERRIREALLVDDRIQSIENMQIDITGDEALVTFTVVSIYGDFKQEVSANV